MLDVTHFLQSSQDLDMLKVWFRQRSCSTAQELSDGESSVEEFIR